MTAKAREHEDLPTKVGTGAVRAPSRPSGRPSKRGSRRESLLAGAAVLFNARGIAGTSLADIAERLGLSRASVYYYVTDRADLVFQCYLRTCAEAAEDLATAADAGSGLERTLRFVALALAPGRPAVAVLSEIDYLPPALSAVVRTAHARNVATLVGFIAAGVADGSIRSCDGEVVAQSLIGMLSWANLSPNWSRGPTGNRFRGRLSAAMRELVRHGVAADGQPPFHCRADAGAFLPGPINAFDRREASEMKIDQLLAAASRRFNRNGIEATSLDEIAASLGATKGIFYHYLQDKADLVARSYERAYRLYEAFVDTAARSGASGLERTIIGCHLNVQAQAGALSPLMPQPGLDALPEPLRADLIQRGRRLNLAFRNFLREGVADGSCRACDELIVAQIGAGTFGWLPKWLPPDDPPSPALLAEEICALVSHGLAPR